MPGSKWRFLARNGEREISAEDDGNFDELCVDDWFHLEMMSPHTWWMRVGDACINVTMRRDGTVDVSVERDVYEQRPTPAES